MLLVLRMTEDFDVGAVIEDGIGVIRRVDLKWVIALVSVANNTVITFLIWKSYRKREVRLNLHVVRCVVRNFSQLLPVSVIWC